jgi:hypothetical protein
MPYNKVILDTVESLSYWQRHRVRVTVLSEGPHCACSERVNCVMVPGVSVTYLEIDRKPAML